MLQQINQTRRAFLKIQFRTDMARIRAFRSMLTSLYRQGRKLRLKGAARNSTKTNKLWDKGWVCVGQAQKLKDQTYICGFKAGEGRTLTLALAFLNGTPYCMCERDRRTPPNLKALTDTLRECLPKDMQENAEATIKGWLGNRAPREISDEYLAQQEEQKKRAELLALHKQEAELKRRAEWSAQRIQQAQQSLQDAEAKAQAEQKALAELQARRLALRAQMGAQAA